jgi:hypothetical protein
MTKLLDNMFTMTKIRTSTIMLMTKMDIMMNMETMFIMMEVLVPITNKEEDNQKSKCSQVHMDKAMTQDMDHRLLKL